ncbi:MAG: response regulator, partial [Candidatus Omnitrophica bacterium]|nr:response regulator [Candidatus Omnitrophota bacterium]
MDKEINVVVLDDEENILESVKRLFFREAFGIATTSDHQTALQHIEKEKIKVVLSDQRMPNISGVEF